MDRKSIEHVLRGIGVDTGTMKKSGEWWQISCPLAKWTHEKGTDKNPSFGIREGIGISAVHCFSCGFSGGVISLLREYGRYAIPEGLITREDIDELVNYVLLSEDDMGDVRVTGMLLDQPVVVPQEIESCLGMYHEYFGKRGIDEEVAKKWGLGWYDIDDRVLFPVFRKEGKHRRLLGVVGRTVVGEEPRYRNYPPKFKKAEALYGEWLVPDKLELLVVVEGSIDAIKVNMAIEEYGFEKIWCVALMGADPSKTQLDKMVALADEVCCMLDNDTSGKMGTLKIAGGSVGSKSFEGIGRRCLVSVVDWPEEVKDADELEGKEIVRLIEERRFMIEEILMRELRI